MSFVRDTGTSCERRTLVMPGQQRKAYLKRAYEDGYQDGLSGKLRTSASYFSLEDEEGIAAYRRGLRIGRREKARA